MRWISLVIAVAALGAQSCSFTPPAPSPLPAPSLPSSPPPAKAPPAPRSSTAAMARPPPDIKVLGSLGEITIASYPPTGFDKLKPEQRLLAYHLTQAALAGDPIFTMQASRDALPITRAVGRLLARKDKLDPAFRDKLVDYRLRLFVHHGLFDSSTGQKVLPPFSREALEAAARGLQIAIPGELLTAMFDSTLAPAVTSKTPGKGKDPRPLPPATQELGRVVRHLEDAIAVAPPLQKEALQHLVRYFKTGAPEASFHHDVTWLKRAFPVDYLLGFIETSTAFRGRKGTLEGFEGFVAIPDPARDPSLQALSWNAQYFELKMPWEPRWKRSFFRIPAVAAVTVLAAAGGAGPMTFTGKTLPSAQNLRENYGAKTFVALSVADSRRALMGAQTIDEFAPAEARAELHRCESALDFAATSLHEMAGHGSGTVSRDLTAEPEELLAPYYTTVEEGRAELVADYLSEDPKTVEIGLLPDAGCARIYPQYRAMRQLLELKSIPVGDVAEEDHLRAAGIAFGYLKDRGAVSVEEREGKTFFVVKDPDAWHRVTGELLREHQRIKATADKAALLSLVERYGTRINPKWRDEVLARLSALNLPRGIATIPPILTPVRDASGTIVDAGAAQTTDLAAYVEALDRAEIP